MIFFKKKKQVPDPAPTERYFWKYSAILVGNEGIDSALNRETWTCSDWETWACSDWEIYTVMSSPDRVVYRKKVPIEY
jgi:hypothetical protein